MPIGRQIRRDQRPRARPDDHPHLILKLAQQHRQRPGRVRPTRPAPTQHQTRAAPSITLHAHDPNPTRITATRATRPRLNRIAAPAARRGHQPARSSSSRVARPVIGPPRSAPPGSTRRSRRASSGLLLDPRGRTTRIRKWIAHGGGERTHAADGCRPCPSPAGVDLSNGGAVRSRLRSAAVRIAIRPPCTNGRHTVKRVMLDLRLDFRSRSRAPQRFPEVGR